MVRAVIDEAVCPACDHRGLEYTAENVDLPFLGESVETMLRCDACGFRHTDFILTASHAPTRWRYVVRTADDMMVRVVRSSSGTIRIPELGVLVEPGVASEASIAKIEGILVRVERFLEQLVRDADDGPERARAAVLVERMGRLREGKGGPVTVILEDPMGTSSILAEGANSERIPDDEASGLKLGLPVYEPAGHLQGPS
jgi:zinc finger protein